MVGPFCNGWEAFLPSRHDAVGQERWVLGGVSLRARDFTSPRRREANAYRHPGGPTGRSVRLPNVDGRAVTGGCCGERFFRPREVGATAAEGGRARAAR